MNVCDQYCKVIVLSNEYKSYASNFGLGYYTSTNNNCFKEGVKVHHYNVFLSCAVNCHSFKV